MVLLGSNIVFPDDPKSSLCGAIKKRADDIMSLEVLAMRRPEHESLRWALKAAREELGDVYCENGMFQAAAIQYAAAYQDTQTASALHLRGD